MKKAHLNAIVVVVLATIGHNAALAQRSIGKIPAPPASAAHQDDLDITQWVGKKFILLPIGKKLQQYGYDMHLYPGFGDPRDHPTDMEIPDTGSLKYDLFKGKTMTCTAVGPDEALQEITFNMDDPPVTIYAEASRGSVIGIAPYDDLAKAKARWLGKTIWPFEWSISAYDAETDTVGDVKVGKFAPLKVTDVWWGMDEDRPLWLTVETAKGETGYIETGYSWTNVSTDLVKDGRPWETSFLEADPHKLYNWPAATWSSIEAQKIVVGMTKQQVIFSWGPPGKKGKDIYADGTHEQWIYGNQYVYFDNGHVSGIQDALSEDQK